MESTELVQTLAKYIEINDRVTFDKLFKRLLCCGYDHEESKDIMLYCCNLSALVVQERIENEYYLRLSEHQEISEDLIDLLQDREMVKHIF